MSEQFNPQAAVKSIRRGSGSFQYMQVKDRILWFRKDNPEGVIQAELVRWDAEVGVAVVLATVTAPGLGLAQGLGSACRTDLADKASRKAVQPDQVESYVEFAETAAVGRALGRLGYGTEDALDVTPVDSPHDTGPQEPQRAVVAPDAHNRPQAAPNAPTPIRAASAPAGTVSESASVPPSVVVAGKAFRHAAEQAGFETREAQDKYAREQYPGRGLSTLTAQEWRTLEQKCRAMYTDVPAPEEAPIF